MPTNGLTKISEPPDSKLAQSIEQTIREWLVTFAEIHRKNGAPYPLTPVMTALWIKLLGDLDTDVLDAACRRLAQVGCRREFPIPADVRAHIKHAQELATSEAAERAYERVIELKRIHWCPDMPGGFTKGMPKLSERVMQACRSAGIFRDYESADQLAVWGKKRFIESFLAWDESERGKYLLPDGEVKDILTGYANLKSLPWTQAKTAPTLPAEERLRITDELAAAARQVLQSQKPKESYKVEMSDDRRKALRRQAELIKSKYPASDAPQELRRFLLEPAPPIAQRAEDLAP